MNTTKLDLHEALEASRRYRFAYIRRLSSVRLGKRPEKPELGDLVEARFFDRAGELRIFRDGDALRAVVLEETGDPVTDETFQIGNRRFGKSVSVRRILSFDEDGQAFVQAERLLDWEG